MNCHCTLYKRNLYQYIKKYEYLHVLPIFSNFVFMPKDQMTGGILFLSCLSVVNINIRCNCLTICDRDLIWHGYSTSSPFLMTLTFTLKKKTFLGRCCRQGNSVSVCVRNLPFFPKISYFAPFRFGSIAYIFNKIVNHHCINTNAYTNT